jgi:hypothetical protein
MPPLKNLRMWFALGAYAALAGLAYATLYDPFRIVVWVLCGAFAVLTLAHSRRDG